LKETIEVHFFDLSKDLYGSQLTVELLIFLRNEQKFSSIEELKNQLFLDKEKSLELISAHI
jgi:riboflavin kinase/FMN adenylyltransferase